MLKLHVRFARVSDTIFFQNGRAIQRAELFATKYRLVASPVRGWLHMRFSPRAGDVTFTRALKRMGGETSACLLCDA